MAPPVNSARPTEEASPSQESPIPISPPSPIGISNQPSTLNSHETPQPGILKSFANRVRNFILLVVEKLWLGFSAVLFRGSKDLSNVPTPPPSKPTHVTSQRPTPSPTNTENPQPVTTVTFDQDPFSQLPITSVQQEGIFKVVNMLGEGVMKIGLNRRNLRKWQTQIGYVHPLKFLGYIFNHSTLPLSLESCKTTQIPLFSELNPWNIFIEELSKSFDLEQNRGSLDFHKAGFARSLNVSLADLNPFFENKNWKGLVLFLIEVKLDRRASIWVEPEVHAGPTILNAPPANIPTEQKQPTEPPPAAPSSVSEPVLSSSLTSGTAHSTLTPAHQKLIQKLVGAYAKTSIITLGWNKDALKKDWKDLETCNPITLLTFLADKELTSITKMSSPTKLLFKNALKEAFATEFPKYVPNMQWDTFVDNWFKIHSL